MSFLIFHIAVQQAERNSIMDKTLQKILSEFTRSELDLWKNKKKDFLNLMIYEMLERIGKNKNIEKYHVKEYLDDKIFWWSFKK